MPDKLPEIDVLKELQKDNPWWRDNSIPEDMDKPFHRSDFYIYKKFLNSRDIQVIIGPRRVGKTILLFQSIKHLIKDCKVVSKNLIYLDLSKPYIAFGIANIESCLNIYQEKIIKKDFGNLSSKEHIYIFIDEVQKQKEWAVILESYRSRYKHISFIVTGSSGTEIDKTASESLVGRANYRYILPLKFRDIVRKELNYNEKKLDQVKDLSNIFEEYVLKGQLKKLYTYLVDLFVSNIDPNFEIKVKNILDSYLLKGGYPEFYEEYKHNHWYFMSKRMRDDYFQRIISRDVVEAFRVSRPDVIRKIYLLISFDTSNLANFGNYAKIVGAKENTVGDYFSYLTKSFLVTSAERYFEKKRPKGEQKKVYVGDIGMRNSVLGVIKSDLGTPNARLGSLVETVVHSHCMRLKYRMHPTMNFNVEYWISKDIGEIDIIMDLKSVIVPIEVKYQNRIKSRDLTPLKHFLETNSKAPFGIVVTKNTLNIIDGNILAIPAWLFLLIC
ncbi:MAG: ATP-binding protein [Candidatus Nanoarchaeia archaeon]